MPHDDDMIFERRGVRTGQESVRRLPTPWSMMLIGIRRCFARGGCASRSTNGRRLGIFRDVMLLGTCKHLTRDHSGFGIRIAECATLADTAKE